MDEQHYSLDEIFRQSLGDYREAPPAAAWEKVVAKLDGDEKNRRKGFFWPWPWIVLLLLLTVGGGIFLAARYQDGQHKHEQAEDFTSARQSADQEGSAATPVIEPFNNERNESTETSQLNSGSGKDKISPNNPEGPSGASIGTTAKSAEEIPGTDHSETTGSNVSDNPVKKSNTHSTKNKDDVMWASADDENVYSSETKRKKAGSSTGEVSVANDPVQTENASSANSTAQKNANTPKARKASKSVAAVDPNSGTENPVSVPAEKKAKKKNSAGKQSSESSAADLTATRSGNETTDPTGKTSKSNKSLNAKSPSGNQTTKTSSTSMNETANSASGKTGSKSTRKAVPTETQASPDAASTTASKPSADATSAASSSAKAGSSTAPALAKAEPEKIPTQRKAGTSMAATSPSFEESKAKDELALPEPQAAPNAESATVKDSSKTAKTDETSEPEKDSKGGEGGSSGDDKARRKPSFSLALHGGYTFATQKPAPNQFSAGFRFLWHFDPGISVGIQPSIRYGNMSTISSASQAYQRTTPVTVDSVVQLDSAGKVMGRTYFPEQTFDSIVVAGLSAGGPIWQFEIPIILNYKIGKGWFAYGGPSLNFGGKIDHSSGDIKTYTFHRIDTVFSQPGTVQPPQSPSSFANYFGTSGLPQYSTYKPADDEWKDPLNLRFGYLVGLGYEHKRLSFDVSLRQQVSGFSEVKEPYKKVYSSPYVQIGVGWKIIPEKTKK